MLSKDFDKALDVWIKELQNYYFTQLLIKPSPASWSLGQVYMHLIQSTRYFVGQIEICTSNNDNLNEEAFADAKTMFLDNELPDTLLPGPPSNATTPQPESREQLATGLARLRDETRKAGELISKTQFKGKTRHFGLGYFTAKEWLQFAEMHLRHHLRQKKRLDDYLKRIHSQR